MTSCQLIQSVNQSVSNQDCVLAKQVSRRVSGLVLIFIATNVFFNNLANNTTWDNWYSKKNIPTFYYI